MSIKQIFKQNNLGKASMKIVFFLNSYYISTQGLHLSSVQLQIPDFCHQREL